MRNKKGHVRTYVLVLYVRTYVTSKITRTNVAVTSHECGEGVKHR